MYIKNTFGVDFKGVFYWAETLKGSFIKCYKCQKKRYKCYKKCLQN